MLVAAIDVPSLLALALHDDRRARRELARPCPVLLTVTCVLGLVVTLMTSPAVSCTYTLVPSTSLTVPIVRAAAGATAAPAAEAAPPAPPPVPAAPDTAARAPRRNELISDCTLDAARRRTLPAVDQRAAEEPDAQHDEHEQDTRERAW